MRSLIACAALVAASTAARAQDPASAPAPSDAERVVLHAVDAWRGVKAVRATFEQSLTNTLTGTSARATGEFQQRRPDRLSVRFTNPSGDAIVADGEFVWMYLPSSTPGQVIREPMTRDGTGTVDFTDEFLRAPLRRYAITDLGAGVIDGRNVHAVRLVPKPGESSRFNRATVWVDDADGYIRQFEVQESNGVTRRVHLTSLDVNVDVDAGAFTFKVPPGVKVVSR
jgi:outer membrane lipoprotein carrier protein